MTRLLPWAALALLALAGLAFWPAYLSRPAQAGAATHVHALLGVVWLLLLAAQPWWIATARRRAHRAAGRAGIVVGLAFVVSGIGIAHASLVRMGPAQFEREGAFVYLPLAMAAIFGAALALGWRWRTSMPVHGRFMAATALPLLDPVLARILYAYGPPLPFAPLAQLPAFTLVVAVLVLMVRTLPAGTAGRAHLVRFAWAVVAVLAGFAIVPGTEAWRWFVVWFRDMPLT